MSKLNDFKSLFYGVHCPDMRCKGSTTALISIMLANPKAIMIVHTAHVGDGYAKQYGIDRRRFFSIRNGPQGFCGQTIEGPILVDLPAIADVLEQVRMEQAEELENMKRGTTHQKELEELRMEKEELIRTNDKLKTKISDVQDAKFRDGFALRLEMQDLKESNKALIWDANNREDCDEALKRQKDEIKFLQKQNETLTVSKQHLRNRNAQLLGAFSKIDAVLAEKLIDPIPEDSL